MMKGRPLFCNAEGRREGRCNASEQVGRALAASGVEEITPVMPLRYAHVGFASTTPHWSRIARLAVLFERIDSDNVAHQALATVRIPPPHEDKWLSRPDRPALWGASDNAQLEHYTLSATDCEIRRAPASKPPELGTWMRQDNAIAAIDPIGASGSFALADKAGAISHNAVSGKPLTQA